MVGIVIVSHSADLAKGVCEMAAAIAGPEVALVPVGGDAKGGLGTDHQKIMAAIQQAQSGNGVVVLADLGSAVLSATTAIRQLGGAVKARACIADAPLVEGAVSAAVEASMDSDMQAVAHTAATAYELHKV